MLQKIRLKSQLVRFYWGCVCSRSFCACMGVCVCVGGCLYVWSVTYVTQPHFLLCYGTFWSYWWGHSVSLLLVLCLYTTSSSFGITSIPTPGPCSYRPCWTLYYTWTRPVHTWDEGFSHNAVTNNEPCSRVRVFGVIMKLLVLLMSFKQLLPQQEVMQMSLF